MITKCFINIVGLEQPSPRIEIAAKLRSHTVWIVIVSGAHPYRSIDKLSHAAGMIAHVVIGNAVNCSPADRTARVVVGSGSAATGHVPT